MEWSLRIRGGNISNRNTRYRKAGRCGRDVGVGPDDGYMRSDRGFVRRLVSWPLMGFLVRVRTTERHLRRPGMSHGGLCVRGAVLGD